MILEAFWGIILSEGLALEEKNSPSFAPLLFTIKESRCLEGSDLLYLGELSVCFDSFSLEFHVQKSLSLRLTFTNVRPSQIIGHACGSADMLADSMCGAELRRDC